MKSFLTLTVLCCVVAAAGQPSSPQAEHQPTRAETLDVYEAVIRHQIKTWELAAHSYCIEIEGRDAEAELLQRLAPLPVKGRSGCRKSGNRVIMSVEDKKSKKNAVIFDLSRIHWRSDSEIEVHGGYFCGSTCMAGGLYHAVRDSSGWHVTKFDVTVIS